MHIVILGCGRVGSLLAQHLDESGHSVAIIDQDAGAFRRLNAEFSGLTVKGIGFDRETLENAGITRAQAFAAVSSGDNTNILAARVARETYGVDRVVARIYDPRRAEIYERLGIPTVATVAWTSSQIMRRVLPLGSDELFRDPSGLVAMGEVSVGDRWIGQRTTDLELASRSRISFISRYGEPVIPNVESVIQEGDHVYVTYHVADVEHVERVFAQGPQEA
ncbi:MAG: TrkA family potassium uptake protein [Candidatus Nanopelagicales bacterium]|nr:TrkA family potassium uptake protein [Candidatus Nanopelagicales bacterium]